jgi:hypothetical protein
VDTNRSDETVVFHGSGGFDNTTATPGIELVFTQPFFYDPAAGNLLMDIRMFMGATTPPFQPVPTTAFFRRMGDSASFAWAVDVNAPIADIVNTPAMLTYFAITPIPEPGVTALVLAAIALAAFVHWRRRAAARWPRQARSGMNL